MEREALTVKEERERESWPCHQGGREKHQQWNKRERENTKILEREQKGILMNNIYGRVRIVLIFYCQKRVVSIIFLKQGYLCIMLNYNWYFPMYPNVFVVLFCMT